MDGDVAALAGAPGSVSGRVPFHNTSDEVVTVTEVTIDDESSTASLVVPVEPIEVGPGGRARVGVRLQLPPQTAPGSYPLEVTIAGTTSAVVAHVAEARELGLSPDLLVVDNVPDAELTRTVVVANEGNVPAHLADVGSLPLYREDTALPTLRALAVASDGRQLDRIEPLPEAHAHLQVATGGTVTIAPGAVEAVEVAVTVPGDLPQTARFVGALPIGVRTLLVVVVPAGPLDLDVPTQPDTAA